MTIKIRQATWRDLDVLEQLYTEAMRPYVELTHQWNDKLFRKNFNPVRIQVLVEATQIIGMLKVIRETNEIFFADMQLVPQRRNLGIGGFILSKVIAEASRLDLPIRLKVLRGNPAKKLYERFGFQIVEETETAFHMRRAANALPLPANNKRISIEGTSALLC